MIPRQHLLAWSRFAPWPDTRMVEQDLLICRALVHIFSDDALREGLRFRGGTALHKLHFPKPLRYSEDIDLVRTVSGPIGPVVDRLRAQLQPWLGRASFVRSPLAPKLVFRVAAADDAAHPLHLKIEINTRETKAFAQTAALPLEVTNPWFSGQTTIPTFSREEMLATKLRALLQRDKGRDLYDLASGLDIFADLDIPWLMDIFHSYMQLSGQAMSRSQAQERMLAKLARPRFMHDLRPLLSADRADALTEAAMAEAFRQVFTTMIDRLPGKPWARLQTAKQRLGIDW